MHERKMPRPDWLDYTVGAILFTALFLALPVFAGRYLTPFRGGHPVRLSGSVLREMEYIARAREALAILADAHNALAGVRPVGSIEAAEAFERSAEMERLVSELRQLQAKLEEAQPPGRFRGLHGELVKLARAYTALAENAWAYYGDLDPERLDILKRGLAEGYAELGRIQKLLAALDYERAGEVSVHRTPHPTPGGEEEIPLPPVGEE